MIKYVLPEGVSDLEHGTIGAAGYDLRAHLSTERVIGPLDIGADGVIKPGERWLVPTGLYLEMPKGILGALCSRSGLSIHHGVVVLNAPGIVDSDYRGEVKVTLINLGRQPFTIVPGERIAQIVFQIYFPEGEFIIDAPGTYLTPTRVRSVTELRDTPRSASGFGSTGRT